MAPPKRTRAQIERDRADIARLYLKGWTQQAITEWVCKTYYTERFLTRQAIAKDLVAIQKEWRESTLRDFDEAKAKELAKLDELERTMWTAWERSLGEVTTRTVQQGRGEDTVRTIRTEERQGDPRFLEGIMKCIERRCKLLGFDAPIAIGDDPGLREKYEIISKLVPELAAGGEAKED
ncbi:MAG: hypothetical protein AB1896_16815 [Thermodesulfobacteriota bacterium]